MAISDEEDELLAQFLETEVLLEVSDKVSTSFLSLFLRYSLWSWSGWYLGELRRIVQTCSFVSSNLIMFMPILGELRRMVMNLSADICRKRGTYRRNHNLKELESNRLTLTNKER